MLSRLPELFTTCKCDICPGSPMVTHDSSICVDHYLCIITVLSDQGINRNRFSYQCLSSVIMTQKVSLNPGGSGTQSSPGMTQSAPGMILISSHICLTISSALPIHDMPVFSLFPFSIMISLLSAYSVSVNILRHTPAKQEFQSHVGYP